MNSFLRCAVTCLALICLAHSSSAQIVVCHADFNADTVGEYPSIDLPGEPDGDSFGAAWFGGTVTVEESALGFTQNPVVMTRNAIDSIWLGFYVDPDLRDCQTFHVSLRLAVSQMVEFCYVSFSSPNSRVMGNVGYRENGQMTANSPTNVMQATYTPGTPQLIEVDLDMVNGTLSVSIDGVPDPLAQDLRHSQVAADGLRAVGVNMGLRDFYSVAVDDVHVTATNCNGVANESRSWSSVKTMYR